VLDGWAGRREPLFGCSAACWTPFWDTAQTTDRRPPPPQPPTVIPPIQHAPVIPHTHTLADADAQHKADAPRFEGIADEWLPFGFRRLPGPRGRYVKPVALMP